MNFSLRHFVTKHKCITNIKINAIKHLRNCNKSDSTFGLLMQ